MLRLRQNHLACRPVSDGSNHPKFCVVVRTESQTTGEVVLQRNAIPRSVFLHEGETSEMWTLANQLKLGISLEPITRNYGSPTLEERSQAQDAFEAYAPQLEEQLKSQQQTTD